VTVLPNLQHFWFGWCGVLGVVIVRVSSNRLHLTDVAASLVSRSMTQRLSMSYLRGSVLLIADRA